MFPSYGSPWPPHWILVMYAGRPGYPQRGAAGRGHCCGTCTAWSCPCWWWWLAYAHSTAALPCKEAHTKIHITLWFFSITALFLQTRDDFSILAIRESCCQVLNRNPTTHALTFFFFKRKCCSCFETTIANNLVTNMETLLTTLQHSNIRI